MNIEDYDVGNEELVQTCISEISAEGGTDCAAVDMLISMAKGGELEDVADVLAGLLAKEGDVWAGEILRCVWIAWTAVCP